MAEAATNVAPDAAARMEEEVLPPQPTTRAMILGEVVGSFILSFLGIGIGVSNFCRERPTPPGSAASSRRPPGGL